MQPVLTNLEAAKTPPPGAARVAANDRIEGVPKGMSGSDGDQDKFDRVFADIGTEGPDDVEDETVVSAEGIATDPESVSKLSDIATKEAETPSMAAGDVKAEETPELAAAMGTSGAAPQDGEEAEMLRSGRAQEKMQQQPTALADQPLGERRQDADQSATKISEPDSAADPKSTLPITAPVVPRHMLESVLSAQVPAATQVQNMSADDSMLKLTARLVATDSVFPTAQHAGKDKAPLPRILTTAPTQEVTTFPNIAPDGTVLPRPGAALDQEKVAAPGTEFEAPRARARRLNAGALNADVPPTGAKTAVSLATPQGPVQAAHPFAVETLDLAANQEAFTRLNADAADVIQWELRASQAQTAAQQPSVAIARAELPPNIASQIAGALHKAPDKPIEIALNPPELGRVRMVLSASESGMVVQVMTDRADTLDLMRRNIDDLGRALSDLGYENLSFAFGQDGEGSAQDGHDAPETVQLLLDETPLVPDTATLASTPALAISTDSVDIRI